jgi:hypothetical protein
MRRPPEPWVRGAAKASGYYCTWDPRLTTALLSFLVFGLCDLAREEFVEPA